MTNDEMKQEITKVCEKWKVPTPFDLSRSELEGAIWNLANTLAYGPKKSHRKAGALQDMLKAEYVRRGSVGLQESDIFHDYRVMNT